MYAVEMGSGANKFHKIESGIQKLLRGDTQTHRQQGDFISLLSFFSKPGNYYPTYVHATSKLCMRKGKATSVRGIETPRLPHFLYNQLTGCEIFCLMHPAGLYPAKDSW
jgi:hypothetical protein